MDEHYERMRKRMVDALEARRRGESTNDEVFGVLLHCSSALDNTYADLRAVVDVALGELRLDAQMQGVDVNTPLRAVEAALR